MDYHLSYNRLLYAPVIRNLGVMNQMLISRYLDLGMDATARDLKRIDARLIHLLKDYDPDQPRDDDGRWTSDGGDDDAPDSSGLAPYGGDSDDPVDDPTNISPDTARNVVIALATEGEGEGEALEGAEEDSADWQLGDFKSPQTWTNQMQTRDWTPEEISDTIKNGEEFPAPNYVNPGNSATRYQNMETGKFVVRDNITKEILQISGKGDFRPLEAPNE